MNKSVKKVKSLIAKKCFLVSQAAITRLFFLLYQKLVLDYALQTGFFEKI